MPRLVIFDDSLRGIDLPNQPLIIGRSKRSDIPINDRLLSRKHCAIVPMGQQFRLVDLKSSFGTYLNGQRVEREELSFDDVIEIGDTVMVFLDTGAWSRGEGLARLRNPVKAQELIQRIKLHEREKKRIPINRISQQKLKSKKRRNIIDMLPVLLEGNESDSRVVKDTLVDLLVNYASFKAIDLWVRRRPDMKRLLTRSVESSLLSSLSGTWEDFQEQLRKEIQSRLRDTEEDQPELTPSARSAGDDGSNNGSNNGANGDSSDREGTSLEESSHGSADKEEKISAVEPVEIAEDAESGDAMSRSNSTNGPSD